jgi:hypothetical protein
MDRIPREKGSTIRRKFRKIHSVRKYIVTTKQTIELITYMRRQASSRQRFPHKEKQRHEAKETHVKEEKIKIKK